MHDFLSVQRCLRSARIVSATIAGTIPANGPATGVKNANYLGAEALLIRGPFSIQGDWGAFEVALRYDALDLSDASLSPLKRKATSITGALNWYLNPNTKILFNYIRFKGTNSPLVVPPVAVNGTTAKGDAFATRLQFDF